MLRGFSRSSMWAIAFLVAAAGWSAGCRSAAPRQETPVAQPPVFQSSAKPAEKVEESKGFKEATPSIDTLPSSPLSRAKLLNAQGALKPSYFDFDRSELRPDTLRTPGQGFTRIEQESTLRVLIEGNCDERGTVE